jgi:hypothetical protein
MLQADVVVDLSLDGALDDRGEEMGGTAWGSDTLLLGLVRSPNSLADGAAP